MKKTILLIHFFILFLFSATAQNEEQKMQWFADAKLGIFIHWGIYAVDGISESWSFFNNYVNYNDYKKQLKGFTAKNYNPQQWVNLIKESGAKYAVITSKHHDGVSLWNSNQPTALTIPKHSAVKKDVLTPFVAALKKSGLKTGIYYSLPDWSHTNYDIFTRDLKRYKLSEDSKRFADFVKYYQGQLTEISKQFKPDLLWFDGDWEHTADEWKAKETRLLLQQYNPNIIINARLKGHGDYDTPEQGVPVEKPTSKYWELCYTMNDSWGYQTFDKNYKTPFMLIRTLVDCISKGGNLLLDIGPKADGTIPQEQIDILKGIGRWTKKHAEAIYGTQAGIDQKYFSGRSALSKDKKNLYLYLENNGNGLASLRGIQSAITKVTVVGTNENVPFQNEDYTNWLNISGITKDKDITVLKVSFNKPIQLLKTTENEASSNSCDNYLGNYTQKTIATICQDISTGKNCFSKEPLLMNRQAENTFIQQLTPAVKNWVIKNTEALYNTGKGLSDGLYAGHSALSQDKKTIYLFIEGMPNGPVSLKGIENGIARIRIVGDGTLLTYKVFDKLYWNPTPGIVYIDVPKERLDKHVTVIAILLDGPVKEHRKEVKAIESNL
ncbi:MAG: alpha-L-fucosidase [Niabella sp.]